MRVGLILSEVFNGLRRNVSMVISVVLVTFVSLTFVGAAILMQSQVSKLRDYWEDRAQVAVYMCGTSSTSASCVSNGQVTKATDEQIENVNKTLKGETLAPLIANVRYETPDEAYKKFVDQYGEQYGNVITADQMSATFWISLEDQSQTDVISEAFKSVPGVDDVKDQRQYLEPLFQALTIATYIAVGIAGLMLVAAVLLIGTTIRLSAFARRKEIGIMRLVGASNRFIQTPFVLEGVISALIGSLLASGAIIAGVHFGINNYLRDRVTFISTWVGMGDALWVVPVLIGIGVLLAALSAGFAIRRWLRT